MKACFIGLGSIGQRHLKNFVEITRQRNISVTIHALRSNVSPLPENISRIVNEQFFRFDEIARDYDIIFVTNPTVNHYETILKTLNNAKSFFIEKPVFDKIHVLQEPVFSENIFYVACPLRYTGVFDWIKRYIQDKEIFSVRAICSSFLPDWRKGTDYRQSYSAKKEQGGGVKIDLIHELDYLTNLFGMPDDSICIDGKYSHLEIDSEDLAVYILKYCDKIIELHLDYFGRKVKRQIEIFADHETVTGDFIDNKIIVEDNRRKIIQFNENANDKYLKEMNYFLDCVMEKKYTWNNIFDANKILGLAGGGK